MGMGALSKAMNENKQPEHDSIGAEKLVKPHDPTELREEWLRENAERLEAKERKIRQGLSRLYESGRPTTTYRRSLHEIANAHREAAAIYRRRMEELR